IPGFIFANDCPAIIRVADGLPVATLLEDLPAVAITDLPSRPEANNSALFGPRATFAFAPAAPPASFSGIFTTNTLFDLSAGGLRDGPTFELASANVGAASPALTAMVSAPATPVQFRTGSDAALSVPAQSNSGTDVVLLDRRLRDSNVLAKAVVPGA